MKINVFLQSEVLADVEVVEIDSAAVGGLHAACMAKLPREHAGSEFILFIEDLDEERPFDGMKELPEGLRVHLHRHKRIDVTVRYNGKEVKGTFRPAATVGRVKLWAVKDFGIKPSDAAELMLQVAGTQIRPDKDVHIGTLVKAPAHSIVFDLVPSPRVNG